jgi:hypothetical protein
MFMLLCPYCPYASLNLLAIPILLLPPCLVTLSLTLVVGNLTWGPFGAQAPFDGDNTYDEILAGQYEFPTDVNVSDDAKVSLWCDITVIAWYVI